jgi:hypothetical protein
VLTGGATSTLVTLNAGMNLTLTASVYDTAGELVKRAVTGPTGLSQVTVDVSGLASGLYLVVVDMADPNGHFVQKQITSIVVQR